jgi:signal transduction histidine kinase
MRESIPESLRTRADRKLLQVVFNNLVDNALKYTSAGYLAVFAEDLLTEIRITVEDSGPGVPATERDRIFDLFVQGSGAEQASHEGLGLGLYISRRYIEAMGGTLRYEPVFEGVVASGPDESLAGSRFIIKLPKPSGGQDRGEEEGDIAARG